MSGYNTFSWPERFWGNRADGTAVASSAVEAGLLSGTGADDALLAAKLRWPDVKFASADEAVARWIALAAARKVGK